VAAAIDILDLPIQLVAVGSVAGMMSALFQYRRTEETDHWPVHITMGVLFFFWLGVLISAIEALS
jgi:hypothetical protein